MGFKTKLNIDMPKLKKIIQAKQDLVDHNIKAVIKQDAVPRLIDLIMIGYDGLSDRMSPLPEDETSPAYWREEFKNKLFEDLERNLIVTDKGLIVNLGDKEFLGYSSDGESDSSDDSPLVWLVFYLEGLIGEWAYITPELYEQHRGHPPGQEWGRFGSGFMISREDFDAEGWSNVVPFSEARHPFSHTSPTDIFVEALNEFKIKPFFEKAIKASKEGKRL